MAGHNLLLFTIYYLLSTALMGCATTTTLPRYGLKETTLRIEGARYIPVQGLAEMYNLDYQWDPITKKITLAKGSKEIKMMVGSLTVLLNDAVQTMDKEAKLYQGQVVIPEPFARRALVQLFKEEYLEIKPTPARITGLPIKTVIIDPGHGGRDPGALGRGGLREKNVVLSVAKRLKEKLNEMGVNVILTRESDSFVSLTQRSKIANANAKEADFFISIHANASRSRWTSGVEVFYLSESIDDDLRAFNATQSYALHLQESYSGQYTPAILWDLIYRDNRRSSIDLAEFISSALSKSLSQRNRGQKPAGFYVLKGTNIPAILVEVGFISNLREEKKLRDPAYRDDIACAIAEGIAQYNHKFMPSRTARY